MPLCPATLRPAAAGLGSSSTALRRLLSTASTTAAALAAVDLGLESADGRQRLAVVTLAHGVQDARELVLVAVALAVVLLLEEALARLRRGAAARASSRSTRFWTNWRFRS